MRAQDGNINYPVIIIDSVLILCGKMCDVDASAISFSPISDNIGPRKPELLYYSKLQNHSRI